LFIHKSQGEAHVKSYNLYGVEWRPHHIGNIHVGTEVWHIMPLFRFTAKCWHSSCTKTLHLTDWNLIKATVCADFQTSEISIQHISTAPRVIQFRHSWKFLNLIEAQYSMRQPVQYSEIVIKNLCFFYSDIKCLNTNSSS
jgi:hypothetical protein